MEPQKKVSQYFSVADIITIALESNPSYPQQDGERGPIHVLIYPRIIIHIM